VNLKQVEKPCCSPLLLVTLSLFKGLKETGSKTKKGAGSRSRRSLSKDGDTSGAGDSSTTVLRRSARSSSKLAAESLQLLSLTNRYLFTHLRQFCVSVSAWIRVDFGRPDPGSKRAK
jgi:hypothetical protein